MTKARAQEILKELNKIELELPFLEDDDEYPDELLGAARDSIHTGKVLIFRWLVEQ